MIFNFKGTYTTFRFLQHYFGLLEHPPAHSIKLSSSRAGLHRGVGGAAVAAALLLLLLVVVLCRLLVVFAARKLFAI